MMLTRQGTHKIYEEFSNTILWIKRKGLFKNIKNIECALEKWKSYHWEDIVVYHMYKTSMLETNNFDRFKKCKQTDIVLEHDVIGTLWKMLLHVIFMYDKHERVDEIINTTIKTYLGIYSNCKPYIFIK